jgi:hypothetical protein
VELRPLDLHLLDADFPEEDPPQIVADDDALDGKKGALIASWGAQYKISELEMAQGAKVEMTESEVGMMEQAAHQRHGRAPHEIGGREDKQKEQGKEQE